MEGQLFILHAPDIQIFFEQSFGLRRRFVMNGI